MEGEYKDKFVISEERAGKFSQLMDELLTNYVSDGTPIDPIYDFYEKRGDHDRASMFVQLFVWYKQYRDVSNSFVKIGDALVLIDMIGDRYARVHSIFEAMDSLAQSIMDGYTRIKNTEEGKSWVIIIPLISKAEEKVGEALHAQYLAIMNIGYELFYRDISKIYRESEEYKKSRRRSFNGDTAHMPSRP